MVYDPYESVWSVKTVNAVKLEDIAKMLDLSVSTVSRALSGNGRVGEKTRERVLKAVRESDYTVNAVARSLRLRDAKNIGIVVPDITNSFFSSVIKGAQQVCRENGYMLMVCNSDENADYEGEALHMLLEKQVSGLILASVGGARSIRQYGKLGIPVVYIDNIPEDIEACDMVSIDNQAAAYRLTKAMLERGYREIGMITGPRTQSTGLLRHHGFVQAMNEAGVSIRKEWVLAGDFRMESGYACMKSLLGLKPAPKAMIFANNYLAYGAMTALREEGLRAPEDIAVASFDAQDDTGLITPLITSINQPVLEIGERAAEIIFSRLGGESADTPIELMLEPSFVDGGSW